MTPFVVDLTAVLAAGNLTQVYPPFCPAGPGTFAMGSLKRRPSEGIILNLQIEPDGVNGGKIEIWDANGEDVGADVDTAAIVTNAQLATLTAAGNARLIWEQSFTGATSVSMRVGGAGTPFLKGLLARFSNAGAAGTCKLNVTADGGFRYTEYKG